MTAHVLFEIRVHRPAAKSVDRQKDRSPTTRPTDGRRRILYFAMAQRDCGVICGGHGPLLNAKSVGRHATNVLDGLWIGAAAGRDRIAHRNNARDAKVGNEMNEGVGAEATRLAGPEPI